MSRDLISPALGPSTPLSSLGGYLLILTCPSCGEKIAKVDKLISVPAAGVVALRSFIPKLKCSTCGSAPIKIEAECDWIRRFHPNALPRINLSWLIPKSTKAA